MKIKIDSKIKHLEDSQCSCITLAWLITALTMPLARAVLVQPLSALPGPCACEIVLPLLLRGSLSTFLSGSHIWELSDAVTKWSPSLLLMHAKILEHGLRVQRSKTGVSWHNTNTELLKQSELLPTGKALYLTQEERKTARPAHDLGVSFQNIYFANLNV